MRATATSGAMVCVLLAHGACTNDYDGLAPPAAGANAGGASSASGTASGDAGGASSATSSSASGGATSSASGGGAAASGGATVGGAGGTGGAIDPYPDCGNGVLDPGEACDSPPGDGDGCSTSCALEGDPLGGCGAPVTITSFPTLVAGDTSVGNTFTSGCNAISAPDAIYRVTAPGAGNLTVTLTPATDWDWVMAMRAACEPGPEPEACSWPDQVIDRAMMDGESVHLLMTGWLGASGAFTLTFAFTPAS
jgi:cysteine-rich repeat protein